MSDEGSRLRPADRFSFTPRAKKVLESGKDAAESLGHDYIGTEPILEKSGLDPQLLRHEVFKLLGDRNPEWIGYVPQERRRSLGDWALALAFALGSLVFAAGLLAGWLIWG